MRKVILILCVAALMLGVATAAMASNVYFAVQFTAGWYDSGAENEALHMSNSGSMTVGAKTGTIGTTALGDPLAGDTSVGVWVDSVIKSRELKSLAPSNLAAAPYSYNMGVLVTPGYAHSQVYITAFACDGIAGSSNRGLPANYTVTVKSTDGLTTYGSWTQEQLYVAGTSFPTSDFAGLEGFWYTPTGTGATWASPNVQLFTVTISDDNAVVPEPGSMLALGSGLVGLAGFALRRRRA